MLKCNGCFVLSAYGLDIYNLMLQKEATKIGFNGGWARMDTDFLTQRRQDAELNHEIHETKLTAATFATEATAGQGEHKDLTRRNTNLTQAGAGTDRDF